MSFTIVIKFSREHCFITFFDAFNKLKFEKKDCNLILINNTFDSLLSEGLLSVFTKNSVEYKSLQLIQTNNPGFERGDPNNFKDVPHPFTTWTSYYSFQMQKIIKDLVRDDIHIQLEDDSLPHPDAIKHLLKIMEDHKDCACAVTPLVNRDVYLKTSCLNSYSKIEKKDTFIIRRLACDPKLTGVHEIAATGYHCNAFRKVPFNLAVSYVELLPCKIMKSGSDIYLTNHLLDQGYKILLDYDCWGIHMDLNRTYKKQDCVIWDIIWDEARKKNKVVIA